MTYECVIGHREFHLQGQREHMNKFFLGLLLLCAACGGSNHEVVAPTNTASPTASRVIPTVTRTTVPTSTLIPTPSATVEPTAPVTCDPLPVPAAAIGIV